MEHIKKDEVYEKIENELIKEINDYVSSCIRGLDLNKDFYPNGSPCLDNFNCFSQNMIEEYKRKLSRIRREGGECN